MGRIGYSDKGTRKRSDFQKVRSRARKSSPIPKIIAAVVAVGLVGGGIWFWMNRPDSADEGEATSGLAFSGSDDPCSFADSAPLADYVDGAEAEPTAASEERNSGFEQTCTLNFGDADSSLALVDFEGVAYESNERASVSYELEARKVADMSAPWTVVEEAPEVGAESAAVARIAEEGTSNYQLHLQDENAYLVVRLSVVDSDLDEQGLGELAAELASSYLTAWNDAA